MDAFSLIPPPWTINATHGIKFRCPVCQASPSRAISVWLNRRSPLITENGDRRWQEFYHCDCGHPWWAWNSDRPPAELNDTNE